MPAITNRKFFPSRTDISKLIYRQRIRNANGLLDVDLLEVKIAQWRSDRPNDFIFYRKAGNIVSDDGADTKQNILLVYQTAWQQQLLNRYGNDFVLMDATYKTTQYALPLFFLCVQSNVGYFVVASMIIQHEDTYSVTEALKVIKAANPNWHPQAFMIDASEVEKSAIGAVFPGVIYFYDCEHECVDYVLYLL